MAALCMMQNCDVNGLSGYEASGQALYAAGQQLQASNPELFKQLAAEVNSAGLLSGAFAYQPGGVDFTKDALGKYVEDKVQGAKGIYQLATRQPEDLGGAVKGGGRSKAWPATSRTRHPRTGRGPRSKRVGRAATQRRSRPA